MAAAMRQQQQLLQQQQQRQALLAQQAFQNNMQAGMPMGLQLNAQQMHHMRQTGRLGPVSVEDSGVCFTTTNIIFSRDSTRKLNNSTR